MPKLIFVAGPYTAPTDAEIEANIQRCERLSLEAIALGCGVICANSMGRRWDGKTPTLEQVMVSTKLCLSRCDGLLVAEGWESSTGTKQEIEEAVRLGIPTFYSLDKLKEFLS